MSPHKDKRGGTLIVDRRFRGVGRIKRATGTADERMFRKINEDLTRLFDDGRLDILRDLRDGRLTFLAVRNAIQQKTVEQLPAGRTALTLAAAMRAWIDGLIVPDDASAKHKESLETSRRYLERHDPRATVNDLPRLVAELRATLGKKHRRSYNLLRAAARAFVRDTFTKSHPLYLAVGAVEPAKTKRARQPKRLTPDEMRTIFPHPDTDHVDAIAWSIATTGMHQKELWGTWRVKTDRVHIAGTKREGRVRDVPLIRRPVVPRIHRRTFENKVRERTREIVVYDLRGTYAHWMEEAGIPRTRRRLYLGHGQKDVTDLYEQHEVTRYLKTDADKLRTFLGDSHEKSHEMRVIK